MPCPINISYDPDAAMARVRCADEIVIDCETTGVDTRRLKLVGLVVYVPGDTVGYYLPTFSSIDPPSAIISESVVIQVAKEALSGSRLVIGHNLVYDLRVLRKYGVICHGQVFDTLLAAHRLDNTYWRVKWGRTRLNYKLKTLSRYLLNAEQETFEHATGGLPADMVPISRMAPYAVQDGYYTGKLYQLLSQRLERESGIRKILEEVDFPIRTMIVEMLSAGIPVDPDFAATALENARQEFARIIKQIQQLLGRSVDISVKGGLRDVLIHDCGLSLGANQSFSEIALLRLANECTDFQKDKTQRLVDLILAQRQQAHLINSFLIPLSEHTSSQTRTLYPGNFQDMTESGRFSASKPNIQAMPKAKKGPIRKIVKAPPGYLIVAIDYKNIEPRCIAQALLNFTQGNDSSVEVAVQWNRKRAKNLFPQLLAQRKFNAKYQKHEPKPIPAVSALAQCFFDGTDPYIFAARKMLRKNDSDSISAIERDKAKTVFLSTLYGQGYKGLAGRLRQQALRSHQPSAKNANFLDEAITLLNGLSAAAPEIGIPIHAKVNKKDWHRVEPEAFTFRDAVEQHIRLTGEVVSLFGRKRRFAGLYHLRHAKRASVIYQFGRRRYRFDIAPVQLWNYALHAYVYNVWDEETDRLLATSAGPLGQYQVLLQPSMTQWPFRQLSYKFIREVIIGNKRMKFTPLENCYRQGFNSIIQMTAGDVFKKAMAAMKPILHQFDARMILNVHDEFVFLVPKTKLKQFAIAARDTMTRKPADWWKIPIGVDIEVGDNYGELSDYRPRTPLELLLDWVRVAWKKVRNWMKSAVGRIAKLVSCVFLVF